MRGLNFVGLILLSSLAAACGGDSSGSNPNGNGGDNEGGEAGAEDPGGSEAGSSTGGVNGEAGDGAGGTTRGGTSSAGAPSPGGTGGTMSPPGKAGGGPGTGAVPGMPPSMGGFGAGGGTPVEPPTGCKLDGQSLSPGSCSLGYSCDNDYVKTYCYDQGNGVWYCDCASQSGAQAYQLTGVRDLAACETTAEICMSDDPTPSGPVECSPQLESRTATYCQLQQICRQELDEDTGASLATVSEVYCQDDGTGRQLCNCTNQPYQYYVEGEDGTTACDSLVDFCSEPVTPTFEGDGECRPQSQSGGTGYCQVQSTCLRTSEVADGIFVVLNDYQQTTCSDSGAGAAICSCYTSNGSFTIEQEGAVTGIASCTQASEICQKAGSIEPEGEPTCNNTSQTAQGTYCSATIDCAASATVNDTTVSLHGYINLGCTGDGSGGWTCSCSSGSNYETISVTADTAWDACTAGSPVCADTIEVQYGGDGGIGMPVPVPPPLPGAGGRSF